MYKEVQLEQNKTSSPRFGKDADPDMDNLFDVLKQGALAERIMEAARLAMARHCAEVAQESTSAVEAENSTT